MGVCPAGIRNSPVRGRTIAHDLFPVWSGPGWTVTAGGRVDSKTGAANKMPLPPFSSIGRGCRWGRCGRPSCFSASALIGLASRYARRNRTTPNR